MGVVELVAENELAVDEGPVVDADVEFGPRFHFSTPLFEARHGDNDKEGAGDFMVGMEIVEEGGRLDSFP